MAVVMKASVTTSKKSCHLPSKMGTRTQEITPVYAWVQPAPMQLLECGDAVHNAQLEQQRIDEQQQEKTERLRRFQEDVKKRVQALDRAKKLEALEKSYRAVELERNVVRQSALAAEKSTSRKNRCSVQHSTDLSIRHSASVNTYGGIINPSEDRLNQFQEQTNQVHKISRHARGKLVSRRVITEHYLHDNLPGGVWNVGPTLDHPASRHTDAPATGVEQVDMETDDDPTELEKRMVHFDREPSPDTRESRISRKSASEMSGCQLERCPSVRGPAVHGAVVHGSAVRGPAVPDIYPGVQTEEEKIRSQTQRAMYRRLFMDIEREQVKENQRRREHRKKITVIKKSAEKERQQIEDEAQLCVEPRDPVTGQTQEQSFQLKVEQEIRRRQESEHQTKQIQKNKDSERFVEALKRNLREKIDKLELDLPALCCCGTTIWDTNPNTCANNCIFYRNHKAYTAALESLLASFDVL